MDFNKTDRWLRWGRDAMIGLAALVSAVVIPLVGFRYTKEQHEADLRREYVALGVQVLGNKDESSSAARRWATDIIDHYAPVKMPQSAREGLIQIQEVAIPVAVPCDPGIGPPPDYPDSDEALRAAKDVAERYQLLAAGRFIRQARMNELEIALKGCSGK